MTLQRIRAYLKKDGWLIAALLTCIGICLLLGASDNSDSDAEGSIERVLSSMAGAGAVDVAVYYEESIPCGAGVVAEGADSIAVRMRLTQAVSTLLGLEENRVAVYDRQEGD